LPEFESARRNGIESGESALAHRDAMIIMMRTTVNLPEDIYEIARSVASAKRVTLGQALADLVRQGLQPESEVRNDSGFPCFQVTRRAPPITLEQSLNAEDQL